MPNPWLRFPRCGLLALVLAGGTACGSAPAKSSADTLMTDPASIDAVLQGSNWQIVSWRPDQQLEAMFETLLVQQYATMIVRFQGGHVLCDSGTLHIDRAYTISNVMGPQFTMVASDGSGASIRTTAQISADGNTIDFRGMTDPWIGVGQLRKAR